MGQRCEPIAPSERSPVSSGIAAPSALILMGRRTPMCAAVAEAAFGASATPAQAPNVAPCGYGPKGRRAPHAKWDPNSGRNRRSEAGRLGFNAGDRAGGVNDRSDLSHHCSNGAHLCSNGAHLCSNGAEHCSNGAHLCSNGAHLCSNGAHLCSSGARLCSSGARRSSNGAERCSCLGVRQRSGPISDEGRALSSFGDLAIWRFGHFSQPRQPRVLNHQRLHANALEVDRHSGVHARRGLLHLAHAKLRVPHAATHGECAHWHRRLRCARTCASKPARPKARGAPRPAHRSAREPA